MNAKWISNVRASTASFPYILGMHFAYFYTRLLSLSHDSDVDREKKSSLRCHSSKIATLSLHSLSSHHIVCYLVSLSSIFLHTHIQRIAHSACLSISACRICEFKLQVFIPVSLFHQKSVDVHFLLLIVNEFLNATSIYSCVIKLTIYLMSIL